MALAAMAMRKRRRITIASMANAAVAETKAMVVTEMEALG